MFTLYTLLLTLHILLVILWLGAAITVQVMARQNAGNEAAAPMLEAFAERWFPAVSGLTGLVGILLWIDGPWDFGDLWILLAVAGWLFSSALGATQLGPSVKRWAQGDIAARDHFLRLAAIDQTILVLIVFDMVMKPGL
jgi:uncharacterized membrane protein